MTAAWAAPQRRWAVAAAAALLVIGATLVLFRIPSALPAGRMPSGQRPAIKLSPGHADELAMRDLAPLFLPTEYNATPTQLRTPEPAREYFDRDPGTRWKFDPDSPALQLPPPVRPPASAVAAVAQLPQTGAIGIGRTDLTVQPVAASGGHVDVFSSDLRGTVLELTLPASARPASSARESLAWKPLEFLAAVDAAGLVGPLTLTSSSGAEEVDNFFRNYLATTFRIGDRLPPGFYRVVVGP